jgi:hypothetical protein
MNQYVIEGWRRLANVRIGWWKVEILAAEGKGQRSEPQGRATSEQNCYSGGNCAAAHDEAFQDVAPADDPDFIIIDLDLIGHERRATRGSSP